MTEYLLSARIRTDREPKDSTNWQVLSDAVRDAVFKSRPALPVEVLGMRVEQVVPMVQKKEP